MIRRLLELLKMIQEQKDDKHSVNQHRSNTIVSGSASLGFIADAVNELFTYYTPKAIVDFIKSVEFEMIWVAKNVKDDYNAPRCLNDDEYLDYQLWEDMNAEMLYEKHLPNVRLFRGKNPNIIFHGGCLGCMSQRLHGLERCKGCKYFRAKWNNPDLKIDGEEAEKMDADELRRLLEG